MIDCSESLHKGVQKEAAVLIVVIRRTPARSEHLDWLLNLAALAGQDGCMLACATAGHSWSILGWQIAYVRQMSTAMM